MEIDYSEFVPVGDHILVKMDEDEGVGGILFANKKVKKNEGVIVSFGSSYNNEYCLQIGQRVIFEDDKDHPANRLTLGGKDYTSFPSCRLAGIIN
jgi:co-chaperonin GroES (HSP10)